MKVFPNIRKFAWKSTKEQKWNTVTKTSGSGKVRSMTTWTYPEYTITTELPYLTPAEYRILMGFFASIKGGHEPFWWLDPEDNKEVGIRLGTGVQGQFQALRRFGDYSEPVYKIENVKLYADGRSIEIKSYDNGLIVPKDKLDLGAVITADYTYYWKVMLKGSKFTAEATFKDFFKGKSMKLVTVR